MAIGNRCSAVGKASRGTEPLGVPLRDLGALVLGTPDVALAHHELARVLDPVAADDRRPAQILQVKGLALGYHDRAVLEGLTFYVGRGELVGVIGPNGSGKSTLLKGVAGALRPRRGQVLVGGAPVGRLRREELARTIAVVPQNPSLPEGFACLDIVLMGRTPYLGLLKSETARDVAIARLAMERTGTWELAERPVGELSGGEIQRVVIARALAQEPRLLLLDEPTAHLDLHHQAQVLEIVRELCREGQLGALAVFHDLNLAAQYCDRLLLVAHGGLYASGTPQEVITAGNVAEVYGACVYVFAHPVNALPTTLVVASNGHARNGT